MKIDFLAIKNAKPIGTVIKPPNPTIASIFSFLIILIVVKTLLGIRVSDFILAKIFSNLSKLLNAKNGGPYAFAKEGFGDFTGFIVAWGYWISCWVVNAGIAVAIISALSFFFPILENNSLLSVVIGLSFIWFFTWVNSKGIKESGRIQVITTVLKLLPLVFIIIIGAFFFNLDNFPSFNLTDQSHFATIPVVAALTLYAFLGIESASIHA